MERLTTEQIDKSLHRHGTYTYSYSAHCLALCSMRPVVLLLVCSLLTMTRRICSSAFRGPPPPFTQQQQQPPFAFGPTLQRPQKDSFSVVVDMDDERPGSQARVCVCVRRRVGVWPVYRRDENSF